MMKKGISAALSEPKRFLSISRMSQAADRFTLQGGSAAADVSTVK
jgi:hypothetical protein